MRIQRRASAPELGIAATNCGTSPLRALQREGITLCSRGQNSSESAAKECLERFTLERAVVLHSCSGMQSHCPRCPNAMNAIASGRLARVRAPSRAPVPQP